MPKLHIETGRENEILRERSSEVLPREMKQFTEVVQDMLKYIKDPDNGGVGLAAPQIGVNKRIIVVSLMRDYDDENYRTIAMVNPEIIEHSVERCIDKEWCLSVPWESGEVERWVWVKLSFLDFEGKKYALKLTDLAARIVQHEIDHLDGVLFVDKLLGEKKMMAM